MMNLEEAEELLPSAEGSSKKQLNSTSQTRHSFFSQRTKTILCASAGGLTFGSGSGLLVHFFGREPWGGSIEIAAGIGAGMTLLIFALLWILARNHQMANEHNANFKGPSSNSCCCPA